MKCSMHEQGRDVCLEQGIEVSMGLYFRRGKLRADVKGNTGKGSSLNEGCSMLSNYKKQLFQAMSPRLLQSKRVTINPKLRR